MKKKDYHQSWLGNKVSWEEGRPDFRGVVIDENFSIQYEEPTDLMIEVDAIRSNKDPRGQRWSKMARSFKLRLWVDFDHVRTTRF
jgi:hypothetical protein